jgi:DNA-binding MarR family transcriptional regulator
MHEMVLSLENRGLIAREPQADNKRILLAQLTDVGRALLAECTPLVLELEQAMLADLSKEQRANFRNDLQRGATALSTLSAARNG